MDAALREVREETGLVTQVAGELGSIHYFFTRAGVRYSKEVFHYLLAATGGDVSLHDHEYDEARWFPLAEADSRLTFANEAGMVRKAVPLIERLLVDQREWGLASPLARDGTDAATVRWPPAPNLKARPSEAAPAPARGAGPGGPSAHDFAPGFHALRVWPGAQQCRTAACRVHVGHCRGRCSPAPGWECWRRCRWASGADGVSGWRWRWCRLRVRSSPLWAISYRDSGIAC